jgi:hypothetical protein
MYMEIRFATQAEVEATVSGWLRDGQAQTKVEIIKNEKDTFWACSYLQEAEPEITTS